jgi:hypothetical protein
MIAPHAAWVWNLVGWVAELRITHPNARLRIETSDAPLAAGVGPGSGGAVTGTDGEWLTSALPR